MHWQEAQEQARQRGGGNFVFSSDENACIAGLLRLGWVVLSSQHNLKLEAQTPQGVELVLEELELPSFGWQ